MDYSGYRNLSRNPSPIRQFIFTPNRRAFGLLDHQNQPLHCRSQLHRGRHVTSTRLHIRLHTSTIPLRRIGIFLHVLRICDIWFFAARGRLGATFTRGVFCMLHDDVGHIGSECDFGCVV